MKICPKCGSKNSNNNRHCANCGVNLDEGKRTGKIKISPVLALAIGVAVGIAIGGWVFMKGNKSNKPKENAANTELETTTTVTSETDVEQEEEKELVPRVEPSALSDSWEEIIAAIEDGTYKEKYIIGDTKEINLGSEGTITMKLVAMDSDELADNSGNASMSWVATNLLNTEYAMNKEDTIEGGWPKSCLRMWLNSDILNLFPKEVANKIKLVKKYSYSFSPKMETISSEDRIWIPSCREIFGKDGGDEETGPTYSEAFPNRDSWQMCHLGSTERTNWMLRSAMLLNGGTKGFIEGSSGGYYKSELNYEIVPGDSKSGIVIGFCL